MSRSSRTSKLIFDPKIEKVVHRVRKETRQHIEEQSIVASQRLDLEAKSTNSLSAASSDSKKKEVTMDIN